MRYGERKKDLGRITRKMRSARLRQPEAEGFIHRQAYPVIPPWWGAISRSRRDEVEFRLLFHFPDEVARNSTTRCSAGPGAGWVV